MWRHATAEDAEEIVAMCLALYREDPGAEQATPDGVLRTLGHFLERPDRGQAIVAEVGGRAAGYAFLVPFWSNGLGGLVCEVDELYVRPAHRDQGIGSALFDAIDAGRFGAFTAVALGVSDGNAGARRLYERLGFRAAGTTMVRGGLRIDCVTTRHQKASGKDVVER